MTKDYQKVGVLGFLTSSDGSLSDDLAGRLDVRPLWSSPDLQVVLTRWSPEAHPQTSQARVDHAAIEFMLQGTYRKKAEGEPIVGDPNTVVFFNPGEEFCVSHPSERGNRGVTIRVLASLMEYVLRSGATFKTRRRGLFPESHAPTSSRLHKLLRTLVADLLERSADDVEWSERAFVVVEQAIALTTDLASRDLPSTAKKPGELVADMVEFLNANYAGKLSLDAIGAAVGLSGWHVARLFRERLRVSLYQYLRRLRLRYAFAEIMDGCNDLTRLALRTGFHSHSHLTSAFHREFELTPSAARKRCRQPRATR